MSNLVPDNRDLRPTLGGGMAVRGDRRLDRALGILERQTLMRAASVRAHAVVQVEKLHEIDRLAREAAGGQALLSRWAATLAGGEAFLADELKVFTDLARMGKAEILSDTVSDFCQEGRG